MVNHYERDGSGRACCAWHSTDWPMTLDPNMVSCERCLRTDHYFRAVARRKRELEAQIAKVMVTLDPLRTELRLADATLTAISPAWPDWLAIANARTKWRAANLRHGSKVSVDSALAAIFGEVDSNG